MTYSILKLESTRYTILTNIDNVDLFRINLQIIKASEIKLFNHHNVRRILTSTDLMWKKRENQNLYLLWH